jgi:hypothetical protein
MNLKTTIIPLIGFLCCNAQGANVLVNGNFDAFDITTGAYNTAYNDPGNVSGFTNDYGGTIRIYKDAAAGMGWKTTDPGGFIELWQSGGSGITGESGIQFAEINAFGNFALYQDTTITGGGGVDFSFAHRGRNGVDVLNVTITYLGLDGVFGGSDDEVSYTSTGSGNFSDGNTAWGNYAVDNAFTAVDGGAYRFSFGAVSSVGSESEGNFLDNIQFGVNLPIPEPSAALLGSLGALVLLRRRRH